MAHEILTVKLHELDEKINALYSRIRLSEEAAGGELSDEIEKLKKECDEEELSLRDKVRFSKARVMGRFEEKYGSLDEAANKAKQYMEEYFSESADPEDEAEDRLLMAEFYLDFAVHISNRALLVSLEAIDAQLAAEDQGSGIPD